MEKITLSLIFSEFNIHESDIFSISSFDNVLTYFLSDENNTKAILEINFNEMTYTITTNDYSEMKNIIILESLE